MTHSPRTTDTIYQDLRDSLKGKITKLTNFTDRSFNYVWTQAHADEIRRLEVLSLVAEMAGFIDYTGKEVTQSDLEDLGVGDIVSPEEVNDLMEDQYLDEFIKIVGVERFEGAKATGTVTIDTQKSEDVPIPSGTVVTTEPDPSGETLSFETQSDITVNEKTVSGDVDIEAESIGEEYNVSSDTIIRFADPPAGVTGLTNNSETTGGESRESNEDLRARAKDAVAGSSEGGTVEGIKAFIRQNIDAVGRGNVIIDEFVDQQPPYVDVIVDGGTDTNVSDAIDTARPAGIRHNLVRPQQISVDVRADLTGTDIGSGDNDVSTVESNLESDISAYLTKLTIDEDYLHDDIISFIMGLDDNIDNIEYYDPVIAEVNGEEFTYDQSQTDYPLDFTYEPDGSSTLEVVDEDDTTYVEGSGEDFTIEAQSPDQWGETLVWQNGSTPDDGDTFRVDYSVTTDSTSYADRHQLNLVRDEPFTFNLSRSETFQFDTAVDLYELSYVPYDGTSSITVSNDNDSPYQEGSDYEIVDDSGNGFKQTIDWSAVGGNEPANNEQFTVDYEQKLYQTLYEIVESPEGRIRTSSNTYNEGTDYELVDYDDDGEDDAIEWTTSSGSLSMSDGTEFYFTYFNEGDLDISIRQKIGSGTMQVNIE